MSYINKYATEQNDVAIAAGRTGQPHVYTAGGDYARGTITWASIQTDTSTITLGGVYVKFTTAASDGTKAGTVGDPLLVNIKGSLTLTLDELVIVLNATANATIATCTYAKSGSTILTITKDTRGTAGNAFTLAASVGVVSAATLTTGTDDVAITLTTENIDIQLVDGNDQYFSLANAEDFTKKVIMLSAKSTGNAIITVANLDGSASVAVTLSTAGQYLVYQFLDGNWRSLIDVTTSAINALTPTDGNFIVGDGTNWVAESGATARTSLGLGTMATQAADAIAVTGGTISSATTAEVARVSDVSTRIVSVTTTPITGLEATHESKLVVLNKADGATFTLPAATGSGGVYKFVVGTTVTSNAYIIQVADGTDIMDGFVCTMDDTATPVPGGWVTAADSDTITLDGSTKGGIIGDTLELIDIAANQWIVHGFLKQSGTEATPFSATVA